MSDTFNTTVANWQGVDDVPVAGSDNLVKSRGIYKLGQEKANVGVTYSALFSHKPYYKYNLWTGVRFNYDRFYVLKDYYPSIGLKTFRYNRCGTATQYLYLVKIVNGNFVIEKTYSAIPIDGVAEFSDIWTNGEYLIGMKSDTGIYINPSSGYTIPLYMGWPSNMSVSSYDIMTTNAIDVEIIEYARDFLKPDDFAGTDSQKLQSCFDACSKGGTIVIDRSLKLDANIAISHIYSDNHLVYVVGIGHPTINMGTYFFYGTAGNTGGVKFDSIRFVGDTNSGRVLLTGGQSMASVQICFNNCVISNIAYLAEAPHYLQSLQVTNCTIRQIKSMINTGGYQVYAAQIVNNIIEEATIGNLFYAEACNICNNVIEGCSNVPITLREAAHSVNICGNYFESNNGLSIKLDLLSNKERAVRISGNYFYDSGNGIKLPPTTTTGLGSIVIDSNTMLGSGTLILPETGVTYTDIVCMFNSGNVPTGLETKNISAEDFLAVFNP